VYYEELLQFAYNTGSQEPSAREEVLIREERSSRQTRCGGGIERERERERERIGSCGGEEEATFLFFTMPPSSMSSRRGPASNGLLQARSSSSSATKMNWCRRALLMALVTLSVIVPWLFIDSQSSSTSSYDSGTPIFFTHPAPGTRFCCIPES